MVIFDSQKVAIPKIGMAALLILFELTGCKSEPVPPVAVLARVGENILSAEELKVWESTLPEGTITPDLRTAFIRDWVEKQILVSAARERGLEDDPWVGSRIDELHSELLATRLLELDLKTQLPPSAKQVLDYYNLHNREFIWKKPHLRLTYWRCPTRPPLDRLRQEMTQNRPSPTFPSETVTIDSGQFEIEDPATVEPVVWKMIGWMTAGQISYPTSLRGTYWMFRIDQRDQPGTQQRLDDVVDLITSRLIESAKLERRSQLIRQFADQFRKEGRLQLTEAEQEIVPPHNEERILNQE